MNIDFAKDDLEKAAELNNLEAIEILKTLKENTLQAGAGNIIDIHDK